jgi:hypothetical protein
LRKTIGAVGGYRPDMKAYDRPAATFDRTRISPVGYG